MKGEVGFILSGASVPKASCSALGFIERGHSLPLHGLVSGYNHLANALAVFDCLWLIAQVHDYHPNLATIVGIDGAGSVENREAALECEATAGAYLALIALWQRNVHAGADEATLQWLQSHGLLQPSAQVHACTLLGAIGWQLMRTLIKYLNLNFFHYFLPYKLRIYKLFTNISCFSPLKSAKLQELKIRRVSGLRFDEVFLFLQTNEEDWAIEK